MGECSKSSEPSSCPCDIGVGGWARTKERQTAIDFVAPFAYDSFRMVTRVDGIRSASNTNGLFFIRTFSLGAWLAIAGLIIFHLLVSQLDSQYETLLEDSVHDGDDFDAAAPDDDAEPEADSWRITLGRISRRIYKQKYMHRYVLYFILFDILYLC
jgi:hypothetical protein